MLPPLAPTTMAVLQHLGCALDARAHSGSGSALLSGARVEKVEGAAAMAESAVLGKLVALLAPDQTQQLVGRQTIEKLPAVTRSALWTLAAHLQPFGVVKCLALWDKYRPFASAAHLTLDSHTIANLVCVCVCVCVLLLFVWLVGWLVCSFLFLVGWFVC